MSRPFTLGGRLRHPLRGGAPAVRAEVHRLLAAQEPPELALGTAYAVAYFAPASGRRLVEEVMQIRAGTRDPQTWRPRKRTRS